MINILSIKIANFRSFSSSSEFKNELKDLEGINIIAGKNNVGKTNILRAIFLFFNPELYNPVVDRNYIKYITGGATKDPMIYLTIEDDKLISGQNVKYAVKFDLNQKEGDFYKIISTDKNITSKFKKSNDIRTYLNKQIKCLYLSTTDKNLSTQSEEIIFNMIREYFKNKRSRKVKEATNKFEKQYDDLINRLKKDIGNVQDELNNEFLNLNGIDSTLKVNLNIKEQKITNFILNNIQVEMDDDYSHHLENKGAGIQKISLIMIALFLLEKMYSKQNKIILLDEPESFLYPLLVKQVKQRLERFTEANQNSKLFITSHSREFMSDFNSLNYKYFHISQNRCEKPLKRSQNEKEIDKYSIIQPFDNKIHYETLKNYGLLDEVDNYPNIILCEGETDKNYLAHIIEQEGVCVQIRYDKMAYIVNGSKDYETMDIENDYCGKGASAVPPLLIYLNSISPIKRKVFVLLDGDEEGGKIYKKIKERSLKDLQNLTIEAKMLNDNNVIEDMIFSDDEYINQVLLIDEDIKKKQELFRDIIKGRNNKESLIKKTKDFLELINDPTRNNRLNKIKRQLSKNLNKKTINKDWILNDLKEFFNE